MTRSLAMSTVQVGHSAVSLAMGPGGAINRTVVNKNTCYFYGLVKYKRSGKSYFMCLITVMMVV